MLPGSLIYCFSPMGGHLEDLLGKGPRMDIALVDGHAGRLEDQRADHLAVPQRSRTTHDETDVAAHVAAHVAAA